MPKKNKKLFAKGLEYEIVHSFKQSSSVEVFKAIRKDNNSDLSQEVLVKVFLNESLNEEFESLSRVHSPYCVKCFGFETFGTKQALILEYIKGVNLFQLIEQFHLTQEEQNYILNCIYKGLKDLKFYELCHGDLSLSNVLINEKGQIKLIDFGLANYEKQTCGTLPFIAPEVLAGFRPNFLSDLYSLGMIKALMKKPYPLERLKDFKAHEFRTNELKNTSFLLSKDPAKRVFNENKTLSKASKSLAFKVKDLLLAIEFKKCSTVKNITTPSFSSPFFLLKNSFFLLLLACSLGDHSNINTSKYGLVKIYTNEWVLIETSNFKAYTPLHFLVKEGWHTINWKTKFTEGKTKIFVSQKKAIVLKDQFFTKEKK